MIRRLRLILPPEHYVIGFGLVLLLLEGPVLYGEWQAGGRVPFMDANARPGLLLPRLAAAAYGAFRVLAFHPFYRPDYRLWLELSPWRYGKRLPVGPVTLVWEDGVVLSLLCLISTVTPQFDALRPTTMFLVAYLAVLGPALAATGAPSYGYAVAFGLGLVIRLWHDPVSAFLVATLVALVAYLCLRSSLSRFPWSLDWQKKLLPSAGAGRGDARTASLCGWPFDRLGPKLLDAVAVRGRDAVLIGALVGWWLHAFASLIRDANGRNGFSVAVAAELAALVPIARLGIYITGFAPPINLWGRLVTGRWIIPGYDVIFVAPLLVLAVPVAIVYDLHRAGVAPDIIAPVCVAASLALALGMGPSLERWRLTGRHRVYPVSKGRDMIKVG